MFSLRFWGVRGSIPCPGADTVVYGGNTSCLEIRAGNRLVIVDMGTGLRLLGDRLSGGDYIKGPVDADVFITHTHWDHIMGFPVFSPIFSAETKLRIHGPVFSENDTMESIISTQLSYSYWPVRYNELAAKIEYDELKETTLDLGGGLTVRTKYLNHPTMCLGYRFEYEGKSIVTAYDHEPFRNLFPEDPNDAAYDEGAALEGVEAAAGENARMRKFIENADVLVHDSQYTDAEFKKHLGWGHSSFDGAFESALKSGVGKLVFFHHDPNHSDKYLETIENEFRARASGSGVEPIMAREGLTIEVQRADCPESLNLPVFDPENVRP